MSPESPFTAPLAERGAEYRTVDLDGEVHYLDFGGDGTPFVLVHGLGGHSLNYMLIGPLLRDAGYHVYAPDLGGFGLTRAADRSPTVRSTAKLVRQFIETVVGEPALVAGNSTWCAAWCCSTRRCPPRAVIPDARSPLCERFSLRPPSVCTAAHVSVRSRRRRRSTM